MGKKQIVISWKKPNKRASLGGNLLALHEFFLSAEGVVECFDEKGFKSR